MGKRRAGPLAVLFQWKRNDLRCLCAGTALSRPGVVSQMDKGRSVRIFIKPLLQPLHGFRIRNSPESRFEPGGREKTDNILFGRAAGLQVIEQFIGQPADTGPMIALDIFLAAQDDRNGLIVYLVGEEQDIFCFLTNGSGGAS